MTMTAKQQDTLDKVYRLYADKAAQKTNESAAAYAKLQSLCKKWKLNFEAFVASKQQTSTTEKRSETAENKPSTVKSYMTSRRAFIIEVLNQNVWDKASLAEAIALHFPKYADLKKNLQAVSGTIYDLQRNYNADIKVCDLTGRIVFTSYRAKRK